MPPLCLWKKRRRLGAIGRLNTGWEISFVIYVFVHMQAYAHYLAEGGDSCKITENSEFKLSSFEHYM